jgi:hypothetical protein
MVPLGSRSERFADVALRLDETEKLDAGGSYSRLCIGSDRRSHHSRSGHGLKVRETSETASKA